MFCDFAYGAEFFEENGFSFWPDAIDIVESAVHSGGFSLFSVEPDGPVMCFIADMSHEQDFRARLIEDERIRDIGIIEAFGRMFDFERIILRLDAGFSDADDIECAGQSGFFDGLNDSIDLSVPAVDEQKIGHFAETSFAGAKFFVIIRFFDEISKSSGENFVQASKVVLAFGCFDLEISTSGSIEPAFDKDDHGGDDLSALHIGNIVAFDAVRVSHEMKRFLDFFEARFFGGAPLKKLLMCIGKCGGQQVCFNSSLGESQGNFFPREFRNGFFDQSAHGFHRVIENDFVGEIFEGLIVMDDDLREDIFGGRELVSGFISLHLLQSSGTDDHDDDGTKVGGSVDGPEILVDRRFLDDGLSRADFFDGLELISVCGSLFELEFVRGFEHACFKAILEELEFSGKEEFCVFAVLEIFIPVDVEDTGGRASVDFVLQAGANAVFKDVVAACSEHEMPVDDIERSAASLAAWIGAIIMSPVFFSSSDDFDFWPLVCRIDSKLRHILVIFEDDVEARPVPFDHAGFEDECFAFV